MDSYTVWYLLSVIIAGTDGKMTNIISVEQNKPACEQAAQRVIASYESGRVKYLCHEMTVSVDRAANVIEVKLPEY